MSFLKLNYLVPLGLVLFLAWCLIGAESENASTDLVLMNVDLNKNTPVYVSGCKTYHTPVVERKPIYPTVRKNFVTRLCALEVFPTNGLIAGNKMRIEE